MALQYSFERFQSYGLDAAYQPFELNGARRNLVARQPGSDPSCLYLITAHLDSLNIRQGLNAEAPGADDNASGSAAVLEAARLLSQAPLRCSLEYVLFTGEEQGLHGSSAYAADLAGQGKTLDGVLNLDMIAYNDDLDPIFELHTRSGSSEDLTLASVFVDVVEAYDIDLVPEIITPGISLSDHASFWNAGYPAILAIEDLDEFNPYYHGPEDTILNYDMGYYRRMVQASIGTMAQLAGLGSGILQGVVLDAASGSPVTGALVEARLSTDLSWKARTGANGEYSLNLPPGSYTVYATAPAFRRDTRDAVQIDLDQVATQDFALGFSPIYLPAVTR
jgi:hypothetical protein